MEGMKNALNELVEILTSGIGSIGSGIGSGANEFVTDLFLKVSESGQVEGLSLFGGVVAVFGGVGLSIGLSKLLFNWITSLGN